MSARPLLRLLAAAGALACLAAGPRHAAAVDFPGLTLECRPASIAANEEGYWRFALVLRNGTGLGVYGDSMEVVIQPQDSTAEPLHRRLLVPSGADALSDGDSLETEVLLNATTSRARLEVVFHFHAGTGETGVARGSLLAVGSELEDLHPSQVVRVAGLDVELRRFPADEAQAGGGAVLLLPGEARRPESLLAPAARLAGQGVAVLIAGLPRGGGDFAGPASRAAAFAALDTLLNMPGVAANRVGVWGLSQGATLALELALARPGAFRAVASQSGSYDLWATWRAALPDAKDAIVAAAGRDSAGWRDRSPLKQAAAFKPALIVVHGELDPVYPVGPAQAFADAVRAAGGDVTEKILPRRGHTVPYIEAARFLLQRLGP